MQWLENKYTKWYLNIIENARISEKIGYTEKHHIIPRCDGGTDERTNLVALTAREHFICHWLLTKMYSDIQIKQKMVFALRMFSKCAGKQERYFTAGEYEKLRKAHAESMSDRWKDPEFRASVTSSMSERGKLKTGDKNPFFGKTHSEETKRKLSENMTGENSHLFGKKRPDHSEKMKVVMKGKSKSQEHKDNIARTWKQSRIMITCEHCGMVTTKSMNTRWHGDKCKRK